MNLGSNEDALGKGIFDNAGLLCRRTALVPERDIMEVNDFARNCAKNS